MYWYQFPPSYSREVIQIQLDHDPLTDPRKYPGYGTDETKHPPTELFHEFSSFGEGSIRNPEANDKYRWAIDHVIMTSWIQFDERLTLCFLIVWSSGEWSWEPVERFKRFPAFRYWLIDKISTRDTETSKTAFKMLIQSHDSFFWCDGCKRLHHQKYAINIPNMCARACARVRREYTYDELPGDEP